MRNICVEEDIKLFLEYDFLRLFLAYARIYRIMEINFEELKRSLVKYYNDEGYSCLFRNLRVIDKDDFSELDLNEAILLAEMGGYLAGLEQSKVLILEESDAHLVLSSYPEKYVKMMNNLMLTWFINERVSNKKKDPVLARIHNTIS